jgi:lipopolysaccharide heptosyltransferase I
MLEYYPKRILFIRPSALGDVCRSVPVVVSLKNQWPKASIDWLVQSDFVPAVLYHPAVDDVIPFPRKELGRWYLPKGFLKMMAFLRLLKSKKYDLVIDGQGLGRSGLFTWATQAKTRVGPASARECGWFGYNHKVQIHCEHTVDQMLSLCEAVGAKRVVDMQLYSGEEEDSWWKQYKNENNITKYAVLAPTSRWETKQWPVERFILVAKHLQSLGMAVVVVGAPSEEAQVNQLLELDGVLNLLPELTIGKLFAVLSLANLVVANDSAALHIAVGFDRPCIGLYGPTNPERVGPYMREDLAVCAKVDYESLHYRDRSLGDSVMQMIDVAMVMDKIDSVLKSEEIV